QRPVSPGDQTLDLTGQVSLLVREDRPEQRNAHLAAIGRTFERVQGARERHAGEGPVRRLARAENRRRLGDRRAAYRLDRLADESPDAVGRLIGVAGQRTALAVARVPFR